MAQSGDKQDGMRAELEALAEPKPTEPAAAPARAPQESDEPDVPAPAHFASGLLRLRQEGADQQRSFSLHYFQQSILVYMSPLQ
jgi:hypothetical protein